MLLPSTISTEGTSVCLQKEKPSAIIYPGYICLILQKGKVSHCSCTLHHNTRCRMTIRCSPASLLLCAVLLAVVSIPVCTTTTVYVRPDYHHTHCPGEPCHPLSYYEQRVTQYFASDTTMAFVQCLHCCMLGSQRA